MAVRPEISLIISVYNNFDWLRLILDSLQWQSYKNFEVVIADDGSNEESVVCIRKYISTHPEIKILHSWHEDRGWRKNMALNKAVRASSGNYLVFIDGDCIPHPDFLYDHFRLRREGVVMGGRRVESSEKTSAYMESLNPLPNDFFRRVRRKILKNIFRFPFKVTLRQLKRTIRFPFIWGHPIGLRKQGILGANFGLFRSDFEKVNGFDERYLNPGTGEDCDIDLRLENAGIIHRKASHYALMIHKCHNRLDWSSPENARLFKAAKDNKLSYTPYGLNPFPAQNPHKA